MVCLFVAHSRRGRPWRRRDRAAHAPLVAQGRGAGHDRVRRWTRVGVTQIGGRMDKGRGEVLVDAANVVWLDVGSHGVVKVGKGGEAARRREATAAAGVAEIAGAVGQGLARGRGDGAGHQVEVLLIEAVRVVPDAVEDGALCFVDNAGLDVGEDSTKQHVIVCRGHDTWSSIQAWEQQRRKRDNNPAREARRLTAAPVSLAGVAWISMPTVATRRQRSSAPETAPN